jgi:DNA-binding NarL/FixJ family response regulator
VAYQQPARGAGGDTGWRVAAAREREVLALMAEGRSNSAIALRLVVSERAVEKHISNIFTKLGLPPSDSDHRRVLAVLTYLNS